MGRTKRHTSAGSDLEQTLSQETQETVAGIPEAPKQGPKKRSRNLNPASTAEPVHEPDASTSSMGIQGAEDRLKNAHGLLMDHLGESSLVSADHVMNALKSTLESQPTLEQVTDSWIDQALMWLAINIEQEAEIADLRDTMAVSLQEEEERKGKRTLDLSCPSALREKFLNSLILEKVCSPFCPEVLSLSEAWKPLIKVLSLEKQCCSKWYPGPGSTTFFQRLSDEVRDLVVSSHPTIQAESSGFLFRCQGVCKTCGGESADGLAEHTAVLLGDLLRDKEACIQRSLAEMPTGPNFVPSIFRHHQSLNAENEGANVDIITLLDD